MNGATAAGGPGGVARARSSQTLAPDRLFCFKSLRTNHARSSVLLPVVSEEKAAILYSPLSRTTNISCAAAPGARFAHARLDGANLVEADLRGADFTRARLEDAHLANANYDGALFDEATGLVGTPLLAHTPDLPPLVFKSSNRARA